MVHRCFMWVNRIAADPVSGRSWSWSSLDSDILSHFFRATEYYCSILPAVHS